MFTGIISDRGSVTQAILQGSEHEHKMSLTVEAPLTASSVNVGDSVAINGVCLTAVAVSPNKFTVEVVQESLDRTTLHDLVPGSAVNLERPLLANGRFDGHIVQGHVDGVGTIVSIGVEGAAQRFRISIPSLLARYVIEKGSIAVNGTSLTITAVSAVSHPDAWFDIVLIPHTLKTTNIGSAEVGDRVNIEVDQYAKYVERLAGTPT